MAEQDVLEINMLGGFSLRYGDKVIDNQNSRSKKLWLLLEYLVTFRDKEVSQNDLIDLLWGNDDSENPANTLKTLLHRVRTMISTLDFADSKEVITYSRGTYAWNNKFPIVVDTELFEEACRLGDASSSEQEKIEYYMQAIEIYKGDFLPKSALEPWVVPINTYYHSEYLRIVHTVVDLLNQADRKYEVISICQKAVTLAPYDEQIQYHLIKALIDTGAQQAALQHYERVTDLFYSEFGINLPDEITDLYREIIKSNNVAEVDLNIIQAKMECSTNDNQGAFYCEYALFKEVYHIECRAAERNGQSVYLCMLSVIDNNGYTPTNRKILNAAMKHAEETIRLTLRRGDVFTRYSVSQFLLMLPTINYENGEKVLQRIQKNFKKNYGRNSVEISYKLQPLIPQL